MDEKNIRLVLAYDGREYHGWQRQTNGVTIQEIIEKKLETMFKAKIKLIASGRTDAGVHAMGQVCNFTTRSNIIPDAIKKGLNSLLPDDIQIIQAEYVPPEFHARYSAGSKIYEYSILNRRDPDIFRRHYLWHIRAPLDKENMTECLAILKGNHDFSSFKSTGSNNTNPVRLISRAELHGPDKNGILRIIIEANGFLRHMVRNIVGTVVEAGLGKMNVEEFRAILESKDRQTAGIKAPGQGLFLVKVHYSTMDVAAKSPNP